MAPAELSAPTGSQEQRLALKRLKNAIIGNQSKKDVWKRKNLLPILAEILHSSSTEPSKWIDDAGTVTLDALQILASLFHDDEQLAEAADLLKIPNALVRLTDAASICEAISLAALRSLCNIVEVNSRRLLTEATGNEYSETVIYSRRGLEHIHRALRHVYKKGGSFLHTDYIARLIARTCNDETLRDKLQSWGILHDLCVCLYMRTANMKSHSSQEFRREVSKGMKRSAVLDSSLHTSTLRAIATIVQGSQRRAEYCLDTLTNIIEGNATAVSDPHFVGVRKISDTPWEDTTFSSRIPSSEKGSRSPLGQSSEKSITGISNTNDPRKEEVGRHQRLNLALQWLLHLVKVSDDTNRLLSIWNTVLLVRSGRFDRAMEASVTKSFIPTVVRVMQTAVLNFKSHSPKINTAEDENEFQVLEDSPHVLAVCISNEKSLQEASVEADAIPCLFTLLGMSNEVLPEDALRIPWQPTKSEQEDQDGNSSKMNSLSFRSDVIRLIVHRWRVKQAVLGAIAAIVSEKDEHRRAVVENSVVPLVIDSLKPLKTISLQTESDSAKSSDVIQGIGNPVPVLLAACEVAKALCRSVGTLRTSLADFNLTEPLSKLLKHPEQKVQIAATAAVCNIVVEFSPMRQLFSLMVEPRKLSARNLLLAASEYFDSGGVHADTLSIKKSAVEIGIMEILCIHAKSSNLKLQIDSLWALRHLIHSAPNKLKFDCLQNLGPGWLRQAMNPATIPRSFSNTDISGKLQNVLNHEEEQEEVHMIGEPFPYTQDSVAEQSIRSTLSASDKANDQNSTREAFATGSYPPRYGGPVVELLMIRGQGLGFVQNLLAGSGNHEMASYIIHEIGQESFLPTLTGLLSNVQSLASEHSNGNSDRIRVTNSLIVAILSVICNFAGSHPQYRQLLVSERELLLGLLPLFHHPCQEVRRTCIWIVINLTQVHDQDDSLNCKARIRELRKYGILERLALTANDTDLDIKERTKQAFEQINT